MGWPLPAPEGGVLERRPEGRVATTVRVPARPGSVPFEVGWAPDQRQTRRHLGDGAPHPDTLEATWGCGVAGYQPQERQAGGALRPAHVLENWIWVFSGGDESPLSQVPGHVLATSLSHCRRFWPPPQLKPQSLPAVQRPPPESQTLLSQAPQVSGCWPGGWNSNPRKAGTRLVHRALSPVPR